MCHLPRAFIHSAGKSLKADKFQMKRSEFQCFVCSPQSEKLSGLPRMFFLLFHIIVLNSLIALLHLIGYY